MVYTVEQIDEHSWIINDENVRFFLLEGTEKALVIDTGMTAPDARDICEALTDRPLMLVNTHADRDHISGDDRFEKVLINTAELVNYKSLSDYRRVEPAEDGQIIDLGEREVELIHTPGHTPGSMAVLDTRGRRLFSGDPIQKNGRVFMFGAMRNLIAAYYSLQKIWGYSDEFDLIYPCHADCPIEKEVVLEMIEGYERLFDGKIKGVEEDFHGNGIVTYDIGPCVLLCDKKD